MKLVIVESPSKAKTIGKYLGSAYQVMASGGHVRDLPVANLGVDIAKDFEPLYVTTKSKESTVKEMKKRMANAEEVLLATDPDREGEAISWHIKNLLKLNQNYARIEFNEITQRAVNNAIKNPRDINIDLVNAQQARRILDRLVGYKLSPILSLKVRKGLSAGRVQSVALRILVDREKEIEKFVPEEYWTINALVSRSGQNQEYKALFVDIDGKKIKVRSKEENDAIVDAIKKGDVFVDNVKRAKFSSKPNPPFTTSTMQQEAVAKLSFVAPKVTQLAQKLYEGLEIEGYGHIALVTYIRTDSTRVSQEAQEEARVFIQDKYGKEFLPEKPPIYTTKKGAQDAHEAIRPISVDITPDILKDKIDKDLYKLYKLIYERFLASQMANAEYDTLVVHIVSKSDKAYGFQLKGRAVRFLGYTAVYSAMQQETNEDKDEEINTLPSFEEGEKLDLKNVLSEQKFTKPPLRFTDATLIKILEESGIGRPSTYSTIMMVLSKREYTEKIQKYIKPTQLGMIVVDELCKYFPDIMDIKFTSKMETNLDKIADGELDWKEVLRKFYPPFDKAIENARLTWDKVKLDPEVTDIKCPKCGNNMVVKESKYGRFLGCSNYPNCDMTMSYGEIVSTCPICHAPVIKQLSKKKKVFYICANKKNCKFISWDLPAPKLCPVCGSSMRVETKDNKKLYLCQNDLCDYSEVVETGENKE